MDARGKLAASVQHRRNPYFKPLGGPVGLLDRGVLALCCCRARPQKKCEKKRHETTSARGSFCTVPVLTPRNWVGRKGTKRKSSDKAFASCMRPDGTNRQVSATRGSVAPSATSKILVRYLLTRRTFLQKEGSQFHDCTFPMESAPWPGRAPPVALIIRRPSARKALQQKAFRPELPSFFA